MNTVWLRTPMTWVLCLSSQACTHGLDFSSYYWKSHVTYIFAYVAQPKKHKGTASDFQSVLPEACRASVVQMEMGGIHFCLMLCSWLEPCLIKSLLFTPIKNDATHNSLRRERCCWLEGSRMRSKIEIKIQICWVWSDSCPHRGQW